MLDFEKKTINFIHRHQLLKQGEMVAVAVSGGPDSMALLDLLHQKSGLFGIKILVMHVDHMLRGEQSLQDLDYVRTYCEMNEIAFHSASIPIKRMMDKEGTGMQETARKYRYQFFQKAMLDAGALKLAVAQHGDDQVETILMRLTRGSGGFARAGIRPCRPFGNGEIIRPLLAVTRGDIEEYCLAKSLDPRRDPSNETPAYTRNRIRMDVLPALKRENRQVAEHFQRFSEDLLEDEELLESMAKQQLSRAACFSEGSAELDIPLFLEMPLPLQRRAIHLILSYLYQEKITFLLYRHVSAICGILEGDHPSAKLDLPLGLTAVREYAKCIFSFHLPPENQDFFFEPEQGEEVALPNGMSIRWEMNANAPVKDCDYIVVDSQDIRLPITVRTRRPGDRLRGKGPQGTKKVKDLFIDRKVPVSKRNSWPIITDGGGEVLWVPGLRKSRFDLSPLDGNGLYIFYYITSGGQKS